MFSKSPCVCFSISGDDFDLQGKCQFCGLEDPSFTEEKLDLHYWQDCPMLISCQQCEQVVEIPALNEHLLTECEVQGTHQQCHTCLEPIEISYYSQHVKNHACSPPSLHHQRCPLCHSDVGIGEEGWKLHLLIQGCPKNVRGGR